MTKTAAKAKKRPGSWKIEFPSFQGGVIQANRASSPRVRD
jgi:hypothetical protein